MGPGGQGCGHQLGAHAGTTKQEVSPPQGDSGGPLVFRNGNVWTLIGIVSFGSTDCNIRIPAIYTRVSYYRNWIDSVVAQG